MADVIDVIEVVSDMPETFKERVNARLADGWRLFNVGLAQGNTPKLVAFMLKYDEDDDHTPGTPVGDKKADKKAAKDAAKAAPDAPAS